MSRYAYERSRQASADYEFYELLFAAFRRADSVNFALLEQAFPGAAAELQCRYNAPNGYTREEARQLALNNPNDPTAQLIWSRYETEEANDQPA